MTSYEHYVLIEILTGPIIQVRPRLKEFLENAKITKDELEVEIEAMPQEHGIGHGRVKPESPL